MTHKIINEGGINGSGEGLVNINSKDFKALQKQIQLHYDALSPKQKRENILLSTRFQMESYLQLEQSEVKAVGLFIKDLVKRLGIKNRDLARYTAYEESNMSAFLNGKRKLNADLALKLGKIFGISPILLLNIQSKNELIQFEAIHQDKYLHYNIDDLFTKVS